MEESSLPPSPSRCSSGCQSGWTLYLDHSVHLEPGHRRWTPPRADGESGCGDDDDDSMVSDASSGPPPPRLQLDDEALWRGGREQECGHFYGQRCYSGSNPSASDSERSYGSWSRALQLDQGSRSVVAEQAARRYGDPDDDNDLDDTASSSAVLSCRPVAAVVYIAPAESTSSTVL